MEEFPFSNPMVTRLITYDGGRPGNYLLSASDGGTEYLHVVGNSNAVSTHLGNSRIRKVGLITLEAFLPNCLG